jgi:hypothetical protein
MVCRATQERGSAAAARKIAAARKEAGEGYRKEQIMNSGHKQVRHPPHPRDNRSQSNYWKYYSSN